MAGKDANTGMLGSSNCFFRMVGIYCKVQGSYCNYIIFGDLYIICSNMRGFFVIFQKYISNIYEWLSNPRGDSSILLSLIYSLFSSLSPFLAFINKTLVLQLFTTSTWYRSKSPRRRFIQECSYLCRPSLSKVLPKIQTSQTI